MERVRDAKAGQALLASGAKLTLAGLDTTTVVKLGEADRTRLLYRNSPLTDALCGLYTLWRYEEYARPDPTLFDVVPVGMVLWPELFTTALRPMCASPIRDMTELVSDGAAQLRDWCDCREGRADQRPRYGTLPETELDAATVACVAAAERRDLLLHRPGDATRDANAWASVRIRTPARRTGSPFRLAAFERFIVFVLVDDRCGRFRDWGRGRGPRVRLRVVVVAWTQAIGLPPGNR